MPPAPGARCGASVPLATREGVRREGGQTNAARPGGSNAHQALGPSPDLRKFAAGTLHYLSATPQGAAAVRDALVALTASGSHFLANLLGAPADGQGAAGGIRRGGCASFACPHILGDASGAATGHSFCALLPPPPPARLSPPHD